MTKKYTLTTSEETVTENPEDIIRLMKLAGLTNAQPVAEEEVTEEATESLPFTLEELYSKNVKWIIKQQIGLLPSIVRPDPLFRSV